MKRFRLPKGAKAAIRTWLELPKFESATEFERYKEGDCPFIGLPGHHHCHMVCEKMFPSIAPTRSCPCHVLTLDHVIRRAREAIK